MCQTVLGYILASLGFLDVLVLHYLDDFLLLGYGASRVKWATDRLIGRDALRDAGAIISAKSILELVQQIVWLGKHLSLSGPNLGVHPKG